MFRYIKNLYRMYPINVWILTFIAFIFIARKTIFNVIRDTEGYSTEIDSSSSLAMLGIICSTCYIITHISQAKFISKKMKWILFYYLFAWLSFTWAGNFVTITFKSLENICNVFIIGIIVLYIRDSKKMIYYCILFATVSTCMDLIQGVSNFGWGFHHTNVYTITAFTGMLLSIGCIKNKLFTWKELFLPLTICTIAWVAGTSTASYISAIIGGFILFSSGKKGVNVYRTIVVCIIMYIAFYFAEDKIYSFIVGDHSQEALETGTGRDKIWMAAFALWEESPIVGHGFIVGETGLAIGQKSAHNSFISALVNTGIIGITLFALFIYKWGMKSYISSRKNVYASIIFPVIIAICVNLNACPVLGSHWSYVTDTMLLIVAVTFINFTNNDMGDKRTLRQIMKTK